MGRIKIIEVFSLLLIVLAVNGQEEEDWYSYEEENRSVDGHFASAPWDAEDESYQWANHAMAQRLVVAKGIHLKGVRVMVRSETGVRFRVVVRSTITQKAVVVSGFIEIEPDDDAEGWEVSYEDIDLGFNLSPGSYFVYPEVEHGQLAFIPDFQISNFKAGLFRIYDGMYINKQLANGWVYEFNTDQEQEVGTYANYGPFLRWLIRPAKPFEIIERDTTGLAALNELIGREDTVPEKYSEAFEAIQLELDYSPASNDLYNKRGMAYLNVGNYTLALRDFDLVLGLDSFNLLALTNRGMTHAKMGNYDLAIQDLELVIKLDPHDPLIHYIKAYMEKQVGRLDDAIFDFTKSIAFNPRDALTFYMRARTKVEQGDYSGALHDYEHALIIDPNYWAVFKHRAILHTKMGKYDLAIQDFNRALKMNERDTAVYFLRGNLHLMQQSYALAIADFSTVIANTPNDIAALTARAKSFGACGKFTQALADYHQILLLEPAHYQTYLNRGKLYLSNKETLKACSDFITASNSPSKELDDLISINNCQKN